MNWKGLSALLMLLFLGILLEQQIDVPKFCRRCGVKIEN